jgi:hypothetical protein
MTDELRRGDVVLVRFDPAEGHYAVRDARGSGRGLTFGAIEVMLR